VISSQSQRALYLADLGEAFAQTDFSFAISVEQQPLYNPFSNDFTDDTVPHDDSAPHAHVEVETLAIGLSRIPKAS